MHTDGLAIAGNAPSIFKKTLRNGLPVTALIASSSFASLAYMGVHSGSGKVFNWFANMTSVAGLLTWFGIAVTYIRFYTGMKVQGIDRTSLPFSSRLQPYAAWYAAISCFIICLVGVSGETFFFHSQPDTIYTVQRLVGFPPWELDHGRLYHKLPARCGLPDTVRWREVLEEIQTCAGGRYGFLLRNRRDRGKYLRRAPTQKPGGSLLAVVGECLSRAFLYRSAYRLLLRCERTLSAL